MSLAGTIHHGQPQRDGDLLRVNPLYDPRWHTFLNRHPSASVFHSPEWLRALQHTYGYEPVLFTSSPPGQALDNGIIFCRVETWLTGARLVSLPFSDHCQPLIEDEQQLSPMFAGLKRELARERCRYIEIRPLVSEAVGLADGEAFAPSEKYYYHSLDLRPDLGILLHNMNKSCIQRKLQRAQRESLVYEAGRSESILEKFYGLQLLTRRRHQLPPQPREWFRNLVDCLGDRLLIRVLSRDGWPIAAIVTLSFKKTLVYKYGCSDARFHNLGGMPLLFWKAIEEGKQQGAEELDLGRSDTNNPGLLAFKEHLGATRSELTYLRFGSRNSGTASKGRQLRMVRHAIARMPSSVAQMMGSALYRHMG